VLFILAGTFLFNGPPLLTHLSSRESRVEGKLTSKAHYFKNAVCVQHRSFGLSDLKTRSFHKVVSTKVALVPEKRKSALDNVDGHYW